MDNPWRDMTGKTVVVKKQLAAFPRDADPRVWEDTWTVKVKRHHNGYIVIESDFVYNLEIPAGAVIEILD